MIKEAKLFKNGQSQAVRLPKECRFDGKSVYVNKLGKTVILLPKLDPWSALEEGLEMFEAGLELQREQGSQSEREDFDP